jgi:membrane protease YdiL (CAAX protease family)
MSLTTDQQPPPDPPWGVASTIAWTLTALLLGIVAASVSFSIWAGDSPRPSSTAYDGVLIAFGTFASVPVQVAVLVFAAQLRRWPPAIYLGLVVPRRAEMVIAVVCVVAINLVFDGILYVTGRELVPPFQVEAWRTAADVGWLVGLLAAIVVVAPVGEEIVFRGFLFRGLAKPGWEIHALGGIALAWALLHIQYDWLGTAQIFLVGLALGWFRWASGSTLLTIGMHMLINLQSMIETWIKVEYFS